MLLTFEDFRPGHFATLGPRHVTREEIISFAAEFDPQPMHLDEEAGRRSMAGGLSGSGWHMCALVMRMQVDGIIGRSDSLGGLGVDEVKWLAPLRPGDEITLAGACRGGAAVEEPAGRRHRQDPRRDVQRRRRAADDHRQQRAVSPPRACVRGPHVIFFEDTTARRAAHAWVVHLHRGRDQDVRARLRPAGRFIWTRRRASGRCSADWRPPAGTPRRST